MPVTDRQDDFVAPPLSDPYWRTAQAAARQQKAAPATPPPAPDDDLELSPESAAFRATLTRGQRDAYDLDRALCSAVKQRLAEFKTELTALFAQQLDAVKQELAAVKQKGLDYQGIWLPNKTYDPNQLVTWDGSMWLALQATTARPGGAGSDSRAWRLVVKRGKDGKDLRPDTPGLA